MKNFINTIKSIKFRLSDLFLLIGFLPFAMIIIMGQLFMQYENPADVNAYPVWAGILCFVIMLGAWGYYLYLEVYKNRNKYNLVVAGVCATLILLNIIIILVQPKLFTESVIVRYNKENPELVGTTVEAIVHVSDYHRFVFISEIIGVIMFIYIGLFVFPRRIGSIKFLKYLGFALFIFLAVLIIYGYIVDFDKYVAFIKYVFMNVREGIDIYYNCVVSFILNRNAYGMCMMLGIVFAFICHSMDKKWFYLLFAGIFFFNLIFSLCKTGLIISILIILIYTVYRLIVTFKEHKKRNLIFIITSGSIILTGVAIVAASVISKGAFLSSIYNFYDEITSRGEGTLASRTFIWDNTYQLLENGNWLIGIGFGIINLVLQPMNIASHNEKAFPTHSSYLSLLAEGGILMLLAYVALLAYSGYIIVKCFKKEQSLTLAMTLGVGAFVLYSFIETIQYLVYIFLFPIMVLYYILEKKETQEVQQTE